MNANLNQQHSRQQGIATVGILVALLIVVTLGLGGLSIWSYASYRDQKDNTDAKISTAVTAAKQQQAATDEVSAAEQAKDPLMSFNGPQDLGSVTFRYPKTWSTYVANDGEEGSDYAAYLNPVSVPSVSSGSTQQYALRVTVTSRSYEDVLQSYASLVKSGKLTSSIVTTNKLTGTRLDGQFSSTIDGSAVIFKVRDTTLIVQTDSPTYQPDFNATIVPSLSFTP